MARAVFTVVTPVADEGALAALDAVLAAIHRDLAHNPYVPLSPSSFPALHFASFVVFDRGTRPVLVFENCVDDSVDAHLRHLARYPGIDRIYEHCRRYPIEPDEAARYAYLRAHVRRPQLHHLGAPYRSAASIRDDQAIRRRFDQAIAAGAADLLTRQTVMPAAGSREYWTWEILKPWLAAGLAAFTVWLVIWVTSTIAWRESVWGSLLAAADAGVIAGGLLLAHRLWTRTLPDLRRRAQPWVVALFALQAAAGIAWWLRPDLLRSLLAGNRTAVAVTLIAIGLLLAWSIRRAVQRRTAERIATLRTGAGDASAAALWAALQEISGEYRRERPGLARRLWNWKWWALTIAAAAGLAALVPPRNVPVVVLGVTLAFPLAAIWVAILTGWPSQGRWTRDSTRVLRFVGVATAAGALLTGSLAWFGAPLWIMVLLSLAGVLALFGAALPGPPPGRLPVCDERTLADVIEQEDHGVQNHMSLVARIDSPWRVLVLKLFLHVLNHLFYRAVLADVWRGKLFGLPTVHCAQWVLIDHHRFLFLSNYDHSWASYLDDFGTVIGSGIQKIWGQCAGNPGVADLERFKQFVRSAMVPYSVWYRAYEGLTVRQIWNTERLRAALHGTRSEEEVIDAVRRLGGAPKSLPEIVHAAR